MKHSFIVFLVAFAYAAPLPAEPPKTNFVLIMCDDLGWGDVGFNGGKIIKTPRLDTMAANAMKFTRFYAASAVCSPTRGSVMTGRHPFRYGIPTANAGHIKPQELTLAELLKRMGYTTGHFGKWHLGTLTKTVRESNRGGEKGIKNFAPPWVNGFDVCFSTEAKVPTYDPMLKPKTGASGKGWDYIKDKNEAVPYNTHYWNEKGEMVKDNLEGDDSRVIADRAVPFIEKAARDGKPFLAVVWFHTPHLPVVAGPQHAKMYEKYDSFRKNYYGCVTAMDEQVGRIRESLLKAGVAENTMVTFCSDNGPEGSKSAPGSAGIFRGRKRDLYEGGVRVPGLIEWPAKIKAGTITDYPAVTSDYLPTILEIVGTRLPAPRPMDGLSLLPVFNGSVKERPSPIGFNFAGRQALSDNRYKLVYYSAKGRRKGKKGKKAKAEGAPGKKETQPKEPALKYKLYDLLDDPSESKDIAAEHPEVYKSMAATLEAWVASCRQSSAGKDYGAD
ncbi:MAG: sulfatase-like hydrolase/transferase [Planctomycetota bacterium]|jgi:arylsulfatase A-like enzyme|nr:sulfatase-like hydrolase/transferase [Planctomycetota bacterium]MDP7251641.1 sulfatase-like hydrolase/transferase [Planctomycetota bacterium]